MFLKDYFQLNNKTSFLSLKFNSILFCLTYAKIQYNIDKVLCAVHI